MAKHVNLASRLSERAMKKFCGAGSMKMSMLPAQPKRFRVSKFMIAGSPVFRSERQPGIKTFRESDEKILRCGFNENVDVTSATEALPRIEIHDCRLAGLQHFQRA